MVSVGLTHRWRSLFTTGKGAPGVPGGSNVNSKQVTVLPVAPGQSKLRVFFAKLARGSWIRRKPVAVMSTPATTVLSLPSDVARSPASFSKSASQSISLSAPAISLPAVTEIQSDSKSKSKLIAVLERVDNIVDGFHRVLGSQLTPRQYDANLRARAALHFLLVRLDDKRSANDSQSLQRKLIFFVADQIVSDDRKANAEKIVSQVLKKYPLLDPAASIQPQDEDVFSLAANVLNDVLKEFAGEKQKGVYDSYVNFGLMLQAIVAPAETALASNVHQNPFQLALDWGNPGSRLHLNVMLESFGATARATYIQQVKQWGVELKSIGAALSAIYKDDEDAILVSSEAASFVGILPEEPAQEKMKPTERERVRELANAKIQPGSDWLKNINARNKVREVGGVAGRLQSAQGVEAGTGYSFTPIKDPAKAYALEIAKRLRFESGRSSASLAGTEKNNESAQSHERSKARLGAAPAPHPAVQAFKDEVFKSKSELRLDARTRAIQLVSKFSHLQHKFTSRDEPTVADAVNTQTS